MDNSNERQVHIRVPQWVFEEYEIEATENGFTKTAPQIKAELIVQAKIKKQLRQKRV